MLFDHSFKTYNFDRIIQFFTTMMFDVKFLDLCTKIQYFI